MDEEMLRRRLHLATLILVIVAGAALRLVNLAEPDFGHDEYIHFYAAQSLQQGQGPVLPSGESYSRGLDITRLVGVANSLLSPPELASRLPAAAFGVISLVVFAAVVWAMAGPWAAVWATLLLAIYPEAVIQSRHVRFYTYQLTFGLVAMYAGWRVFRQAGRPELPGGTSFWRTWLWAGMAILAFGLAARSQITTLSVMAGWGVSLAFASVVDLARNGWRAWRSSVPLQLITVGAVGVAVVLLVAPDTLGGVLADARYTPYWAGDAPGHPLAFYYAFSEQFPLIVSLAPLVFLTVAVLDLRLAVYLAIWFAVPAAIHSFVASWWAERFVLLATPALFAAAGIAAAAGCRILYRFAEARLQPFLGSAFAPAMFATAVVVVVALSAVVTTPAFNRARKLPFFGTGPEIWRQKWQVAGELVQDVLSTDTAGGNIVVGSSEPLAFMYYLGHIDFTVRRSLRERSDAPVADSPAARADRSHRTTLAPEGTADFYSGVPVLSSPQGISRYFPSAASALIAIDSASFAWGPNTDPELRSALLREGQELCQGRCGSLVLFHWPMLRAQASP
jgi:hypothetical protein